MKHPLWFPLLAAALAATLALSGCSKKSSSTQPGGTGGTADQLVTQANTALGQVIAGLVAGPDPSRPSDIDFSVPYGLYQQALGADPANRDANFGVSVLGLMSLTTDATVNAAFDEWAAYLSSHVPFEVPSGPAPLGAPIRLGRARDALRLPLETPALSLIALARTGTMGTDPQLSGIQSILELRVLPILAESMTRLAMVASDPNYQFIVTPEMQGDPGADPIEIDRTDILALRSGCGVLATLCDIAVAYELSFTTYDSAGLVSAFQPGSGWLALRSGGATRMSHARLSMLGAITDGEACLASLVAETDDQTDDAIKIDPNDFTRASVESLEVYLGHARTAINSGFSITADWDNNGATPEVPLEIHPGALFTNPVADWKAKLPGYTAGAVRRPANANYYYEGGTSVVNVTAPSSGFFSGGVTFYVTGGGAPQEYGYGPVFLQDSLRTVLQQKLSALQGNPLWLGYFYGSVDFSGNLISGTQNVLVNWWSTYDIASTLVYVPTITWLSATWSNWLWPDPSFNGLLPDILNTTDLLALFGSNSSNWQRTLVLDWTGSGAPIAPVVP